MCKGDNDLPTVMPTKAHPGARRENSRRMIWTGLVLMRGLAGQRMSSVKLHVQSSSLRDAMVGQELDL
jgi:hypothetical protein